MQKPPSQTSLHRREPHSALAITRLPNMKTTWKDIPPVPTQQEFLDIVLSRTQRKLPTQIRAGFKISRIRGEPEMLLAGL